LKKSSAELAKGLFGSFTLGAGQFCTKPGIVLISEEPETAPFVEELRKLVGQAQPYTLLTRGIAQEYGRATEGRTGHAKIAARSFEHEEGSPAMANAKLFSANLNDLLGNPKLAEEIFGPDTLLVRCGSARDYVRAAASLDGHLTATILGTEEDLARNRELVQILEQKVGRVIFNGFPTGVEVTHAMVHGGPYPSTSDPRFTSVGSLAIYRFARPVCFQGFPQAMLPLELQDTNPLKISRLRDGRPEAL
jgi:alpha-ketoglutaric semialdehyde dehydrogenase